MRHPTDTELDNIRKPYDAAMNAAWEARRAIRPADLSAIPDLTAAERAAGERAVAAIRYRKVERMERAASSVRQRAIADLACLCWGI